MESRCLLATITWVGSSGNWNTAANWSGGALPGTADDVVINAGVTVTYSAGTNTIKSLHSAATLNATAGTLTVNGSLTNNGNVNVQGGTFVLNGAASISTATITVSSGTLTLGGSVATMWQNNGVITQTGGTINLGGTFTTAAMGNFTGSGGTVSIIGTLTGTNAPTNDTLTIDSTRQWKLAGGTLKDITVSGGGDVLKPFQIAGANNTLNNVILGWNTTVPSGNTATANQVTVLNGLTLANNRLLRIEKAISTSSGNDTVGLNFGGIQTLGGSGIVELFNAGLNGVAESDLRIRPTGGGTLTIGAGITVRNATNSKFTTLGDALTGSLVIAGKVLAQSSGQTLRVTGATVNNTGIYEATTGTLNVVGTTVTNNGSWLANAGAIVVTGLSGNLGVASITNNGTLDLDGNYAINLPMPVSGSAVFTVRGTWQNNTAITQTGGTINLGGTFTTATMGNFTGSGGTVSIFGTLSGTNAPTNDSLTIDSTRQWKLAGGTLKDITVSGGGDVLKPFQIAGANNTLNNVILGWNTTVPSGNTATANQVTVLNGLTLANNRLLRIEKAISTSSGNDTVGLNFGGIQTLGGSGIVELFNAGLNGIAESDLRIRPTGGGTLTIGAGITVRNASNSKFTTLGDATGGSLVIAGNVLAQSAGQTLRVAGATVNNTGIYEATAGTLNVVGTTVTNNGTWLANAGAIVVTGLSGNLGVASITNNGTLDLDGNYAINQPMSVSGSAIFTVRGTWQNNSAITQTGGTIYLGGTFTTATMGNFTGSGGTVSIFGTLSGTNTPTNDTLTIDSSREWKLAGGTLKDITVSGGGDVLKPFQITGANNTLNNVILGWNTTVPSGNTATANQVTVLNGLTLANNRLLRIEKAISTGSGNDTVGLNFGGIQTLGGSGIVELFNAGLNGVAESDLRIRPTGGGTLTIGAGITVRNASNSKFATLGDATTGSLVVAGKVLAQSSGQTLRVTGATVNNIGIIEPRFPQPICS